MHVLNAFLVVKLYNFRVNFKICSISAFSYYSIHIFGMFYFLCTDAFSSFTSPCAECFCCFKAIQFQAQFLEIVLFLHSLIILFLFSACFIFYARMLFPVLPVHVLNAFVVVKLYNFRVNFKIVFYFCILLKFDTCF